MNFAIESQKTKSKLYKAGEIMKRQNHYSGTKVVEILWEQFENKVPASDLCERYNISPNTLTTWKNQFFDMALRAFNEMLLQEKRKERPAPKEWR